MTLVIKHPEKEGERTTYQVRNDVTGEFVFRSFRRKEAMKFMAEAGKVLSTIKR